MKIKDNRKKAKVKFSELEVGDIFMIGGSSCPYMKIDALNTVYDMIIQAISLETGGIMSPKVAEEDLFCTPLDCTLVIEG